MYKTNNIMVLIGGDFYFANLTLTLTLFEIIEYFQENITNFNVHIATPSEYFDAIFRDKFEFPVFGGDFFPNIIDGEPYMQAWTGYFTTRPFLKSRIAGIQKLVRTAEILQSLINDKTFVGYQDCVGTHHDAYTGTCEHPVFVDYIRRLDEDYVKTLDAIAESFNTLLKPNKKSTALIIPYKVMILFNPLNKNVNKLMSFISEVEYVSIMDSNGNYFESQSVPCNDNFEIFFLHELRSFGFKVLFINEHARDCERCSFPSSVSHKEIIHNGQIGLEFEDGLISKIFHKEKVHNLQSSIMGYDSANGGPYIFCPEVI